MKGRGVPVMCFFKRLFLFVIFVFHCVPLLASPGVELLGVLGLGEISRTEPSAELRLLEPLGTGHDDTLGLDVLNAGDDLTLTLGGTPLLGLDDGAVLPLNALGLDPLLQMSGLLEGETLSATLRGAAGPDGRLTVPLVTTVEELAALLAQGGTELGDELTLPGLTDQPVALALLAEPNSGATGADGLAGVALVTEGASGRGGLLGASVLGGDGSGTGEVLGVSVLGGDNSGQGGLAGVAVLGGDGAGTGGLLGTAVLSGDGSGEGQFTDVAILGGESTGSDSELGSVSLLNASPASSSGPLVLSALNSTPDDSNGSGSRAAADSRAELSTVDEPIDLLAQPGNPCAREHCGISERRLMILRGVNFEFDSAVLTPDSEPDLARAVEAIRQYPDVLISVDGHTDHKGSEAYNDRLSRQRARAVREYFLDAGVAAERLVYRGLGKSRPVAPNTHDDGSDFPEGRAENRRVELTLVDERTFAQIGQDNRRIEQPVPERQQPAVSSPLAGRAAEVPRLVDIPEQADAAVSRAAEKTGQGGETAEAEEEDFLGFLDES